MAQTNDELFDTLAARVAAMLRERFGMDPEAFLGARRESFTIARLLRRRGGDCDGHRAVAGSCGWARWVMLSIALGTLARSKPAAAQSAARGAPPDSTVADPHAVQPERPTIATHAYTVAPGWIEIETGVERDEAGAGATAVGIPTELKIGLTRRAQLSVFAPMSRPPSGTLGVGDIGAGVKWRLLDDAPVLGRFAILPAVKTASGSARSGRGTGTTDASLLLISSHDFGPITMDLNAGYTWRRNAGADAPPAASVWTASFGGAAIRKLGWTAELFGYPATSGPAGEASTVAVLAGPTLLPVPWLAFDTGLIVPLSGPEPHALYAGLVWNLGRL